MRRRQLEASLFQDAVDCARCQVIPTKKKARRAEGNRIRRLNLKEKSREDAGAGQCRDESSSAANRDDRERPTEHIATNALRPRAERHAQTNLAGLFAHRER